MLTKKKRVPTLRFSHPAYHTLLVLAIPQIAPVALFIELVIFKLRTETPFWDFFLLINLSTLCAIVVNIDVCPTSYHTSTNQPKKKKQKALRCVNKFLRFATNTNHILNAKMTNINPNSFRVTDNFKLCLSVRMTSFPNPMTCSL